MGILQDEIEGDVGAVPYCTACGSTRVTKDASVGWNSEAGLWEIEKVLECEYCHQCEGKTSLAWRRDETVPNHKIRDLNDRFRTTAQGNGSIVITSGIHDHGDDFLKEVVAAVQAFDDFSADNDPWGEHDFGAVTVAGEKIFWKIDYYDTTLSAGSANPANEALTHRVLTIMLASEY